ncbi:MAG: hypothetical protein CEN90_231 [Parcubacteria group bacterium Licking1014_17]|nr:MAG: hypothetical protein CEN90_231 [Parcubacteria group bacterium Licking1014_17]
MLIRKGIEVMQKKEQQFPAKKKERILNLLKEMPGSIFTRELIVTSVEMYIGTTSEYKLNMTNMLTADCVVADPTAEDWKSQGSGIGVLKDVDIGRILNAIHYGIDKFPKLIRADGKTIVVLAGADSVEPVLFRFHLPK